MMSDVNTKVRIQQVLAVAVILGCISAAVLHYSYLSPEFGLLRFSDFIIDPHVGEGSLIVFYMVAVFPLAVPIMCAVGLGLLLLPRAGQRRLDGYITTMAIAAIVAWLPAILIFLWLPPLVLQAPPVLPWVSAMLGFAHFLGLSNPVFHGVFMVASPVITLAIAIFLLVNKGRQRWPAVGTGT